MRQHRCRGLTLVDVLIALSLLGVFALLTFRLLGADFNLTAATKAADDNSARFDDALRRLRADVANSTSFEMPEANALRIHGTGSQLVEWRVDHEKLVRKTGNENRNWDLGHSANLKVDGAEVLLSVDSAEPIAMAPIRSRKSGDQR